jgi:hypothetical protein
VIIRGCLGPTNQVHQKLNSTGAGELSLSGRGVTDFAAGSAFRAE